MARRNAPLTVVVLAAGQGKRMRSKRLKLLHSVAGVPMVTHVLKAARALRPSLLITIVGHQAEQVQKAAHGLSDSFVMQAEQKGTGHAVLQAASKLRGGSTATLLVLNGDLPTIRTSTLRTLVSRHRRSNAALTLVTAEVEDPSGYGRIIRDERGRVRRIVEDRNATPEQKKIREINCGMYCSTPGALMPILRTLRPDNAQREYLITDAVHRLIKRGKPVRAIRHTDAEEVLGVNTRAELARAGATLYARKAEALQESGVTLLDADRTWVDPRARIGQESLLYPDVIIEGDTVLGEECVVRPGCRIADSVIGRRVEIKDHSVIVESRVEDDATVGPFAYLHPEPSLETKVKVGDFGKAKKTRAGKG